ncbi:hypothetical protein [Streptomyces europaeiscabiei]|uniref:hypothetical protein n=2 Tax=Streptomyces europaeiscabiei TaxID=146819 RepID=UPI000628491D|nr:hypothetical protein [Streptomyces europaeiscabiei]MDX3783438.1 hypothetical protein [Streptomyces europaeiscabiei]MDX3847200.1 hypothetical protein [Streptomyces europaeiscabiei]MDX3867472.1 hypothetical protein [Streptomyces europaeiscabiei]MDX3874214.1 hypothetical protein [Streptomyces europaeiscabiei]
MGLLPVEIKVSIEGDAEAALSALGGSHGPMTKRRIWFAEDRDGVAEGRVPLLDGGVIVRYRIGGGPDDLTVKLRPCTREMLVGRFSAPFDGEPFTYKIEEDWSANRRVLAASLVHTHPSAALSGAVEQGADPAAPIDAVQDQFLHACAPAVRLDGLVALGPILSTKADDVPLDDLDVDLEAWSVAGLEFLEASIRVKPKDADDTEELTARAERKQRKLEDAVRERGVTVSEHPESKTRRVLTALAQAGQS